ncbi:hypothetical protein H8356DRAFT_999759 [Neocallimastix lanati (nom. inval.)]|uniref:Uncharacterized protein n=1 Tax=Neocallimastix californiae TaxID=1754190 RepID=A0A1Y1ZL35_9FUNG|nr:hypothetical protein H8356DRAFT_999759 [Neocallimastix sp. JGI-2020a]ORY10904.1 hypothetical protein LY90DRAFT_192668 [Neocallimastix californiae]|eukprot:ORY10904.1 hypothetical protein LY90DRAFT_192668 [Neocallimastix californiae]
MESLGQKFLELKNIKGQYTGGQYNEVVDSEAGEKYKVMNELLQELSKPGTSVEKVCTLMGPPDTMSPVLPGANDAPAVPLMPGIALTQPIPQNETAVYMIYYWRGMHDYIWFKLNSDESEVVEGAWKNN